MVKFNYYSYISMFLFIKKLIFVASLILFLTIGVGVEAAKVGDGLSFNINSEYDVSGREELKATLVKITSKLYFFVDKDWWDSHTKLSQQELLNKFRFLNQDFEDKIYPNLTSIFGFEWKPGVDGEERITILFHPLKSGARGYFRETDEYIKLQMPESNEREMLYLSATQIGSPQIKAFLAHEFLHLITFNQKDRIRGVSEEIWLNEARAEYASTALGYDDIYEGSNLQWRAKTFLEQPSDPVTEWRNNKYDYASANIFIQYLVEHYGIEILASSLKSGLVGIPSLNKALTESGFEEDFSQIFTDWTVAVLINDCSLKQEYCYFSKNLKEFRLSPALNFLPLTGKSSLSVTNVTKNWAGNWQKFIGGHGVLRLKFDGLVGLNFKLPYLIQDINENYSVNFLELGESQAGEIYIPSFGTKNKTLIIIPSLQTKISGFDGVEMTYPFTFEGSIVERTPDQEQALIDELLSRVEFLKKEVNRLQTKINVILGINQDSCQRLERNLYLGMKNSEVQFLQEFLSSQGSDIYPQGLVTGFFGPLTKSAVIRFQEKYASDILTPIELEKGTGFVGLKTRAKINQVLEE